MRALDPKTLELIADLICGDAPGLKYRKGWELPLFFRSAGLKCPDHDGTTRKWWTLARLHEYSRQHEAIEKVILRLASPKEYEDRDTFETVLDHLNRRLRLEGYQVQLDGVTPRLVSVTPALALPTKQSIVQYPMPDLTPLVPDPHTGDLLKLRWEEAKKGLEAGAYLSVVIALGSLLEGLLLAKVTCHPKQANLARSAPKDPQGKVRPFHEWALADYLNVAHECGWIQRDVKDFSDHLRNYRNMVHPWHQRVLGLIPDEDTCRICWQVVIAAINDLLGLPNTPIGSE